MLKFKTAVNCVHEFNKAEKVWRRGLPVKVSYSALRYIWIMMALDLVLLIACLIVPVVDLFWGRGLALAGQGLALAGQGESAVAVYLVWSLRFLRLLDWIGMFVYLTSIGGGFRKACVWYVLRILAFFAIMVLAGVAEWINQFGGIPVGEKELAVSAVIQYVPGMLLPLFAIAFGCRAVLRAGAEVLDYFGMGQPAKQSRQCGVALAVLAWVYVGANLALMALLIGVNVATGTGILSYPEASGGRALVLLSALALLLLILLVIAGIFVLWGISAGYMKHTYQLIKGLSE